MLVRRMRSTYAGIQRTTYNASTSASTSTNQAGNLQREQRNGEREQSPLGQQQRNYNVLQTTKPASKIDNGPGINGH